MAIQGKVGPGRASRLFLVWNCTGKGSGEGRGMNDPRMFVMGPSREGWRRPKSLRG